MKNINPQATAYTALRKAKIINEFNMVKALRTLFEQREELYKPANRVASLALELLAAINRYAADRDRLKQGDPMCRQVMLTYGKEAALTILASSALQNLKDDLIKTEDDARAKLITADQFQQKQNAIAQEVFKLAPAAIAKLQEQAQKQVAAKGGAFTPVQISEILRLFAGVCENVNPDPTDGGKGNLAKNVMLELTGVRPNALEKVSFNFGDYCGLRAAYRNTAWGSKAFSKMARVRAARSDAEIARYGTDPASVEAAALNALGIRPPVKSGNTLFILGDQDVVGKINRTLGLLDGADISGTTSDTIWALESLMEWVKQFDNSFVINPNLLLLPVAAIVGGFHHTVLEVGMALSINYDVPGRLRIAYAPGFFTSLQSEDMRAADPARAIETVLRTAEQHPDNVILLAGDDGRLVYRAEESERLAVKRGLEMTAANYNIWHCLALHGPLNTVALKRIYEKLDD